VKQREEWEIAVHGAPRGKREWAEAERKKKLGGGKKRRERWVM